MFARSPLIGLSSLCLLALAGSAAAHAENYPVKPVKIINPAPAGNGPDVVGRIIGDRLTQKWGQQVVMVNRPGAGGLLAFHAAAGAEHDGYTLYQSNASSLLVLPQTQQPSVDASKDFRAIGMVSDQPFVIAVLPSLGVNSLPELIALAKKREGGVFYAAAIRGSMPHLTGEWLRSKTQANFTFVPYASTPQSLNDILGGRIPMIIEAMSALAGPLSDGSLKPLAVTGPHRLPSLPNVPTVSELLPGFVATGWLVLLVPTGTPDPIVQQISRDMAEIHQQADVQKRLAVLGAYPRPMSPAQTTDFIRQEQALWTPIIRSLDLKP